LRCGDQVKLACKRELSASTHPSGLDLQFTSPWSPAPVEWLVHRPDYRASAGRASVGVGAEPPLVFHGVSLSPGKRTHSIGRLSKRGAFWSPCGP
jgi:hypothetical protein